MKNMVDLLKSKSNKRTHFRLMKQVDNEKLLQAQVEQYKLKQFRAMNNSTDSGKNIQFCM